MTFRQRLNRWVRGIKWSRLLPYVRFILNAHAATVTVFTRRGLGRCEAGLAGALAPVLLVVLAIWQPIFLAWLALYLCFFVARRIEATLRLREPWPGSGRFAWPALAMCVPCVRSEWIAAQVVEPVIVCLAGSLLFPLSPAIGVFLVIASISMAVREGIEGRRGKEQVNGYAARGAVTGHEDALAR